MKLFFRILIAVGLSIPLILAISAGYSVAGLRGVAPEMWETLATYVELYGLLGFLYLAYAAITGKLEQESGHKDFQSFVNSLVLVTILALIHYQPLLTMHK